MEDELKSLMRRTEVDDRRHRVEGVAREARYLRSA